MKINNKRPTPTVRANSIVEIHEEGLRLFMGLGELRQTLARLVQSLEEHGIDYMVVGANAMIAHGYRRFTEDIDFVMTCEALDAFHRELIGLGSERTFT